MTIDTWTYAEDTRGLGYYPRGILDQYRRGRRQTHLERMQHGATVLGISLEDYLSHTERGEKWCSVHKAWHLLSTTEFGKNRRSADGLSSSCKAGLSEDNKRRYYEKKARP